MKQVPHTPRHSRCCLPVMRLIFVEHERQPVESRRETELLKPYRCTCWVAAILKPTKACGIDVHSGRIEGLFEEGEIPIRLPSRAEVLKNLSLGPNTDLGSECSFFNNSSHSS